MKLINKSICLLLCGFLLFSCGCFSRTLDDPDYSYRLPKSVISVQVSNRGGVSPNWLGEKIINFEEYYAQDSFHPEHKGVKVRLEVTDEVQTSTLFKLPTNIFICENQGVGFLQSLASNGHLVALDDIMYAQTETRFENGKSVQYSIDKKILPEYKPVMQYDGVYYGIPTSGSRNGVFYDVTNFKEFGLFFADPKTANKDNSVIYSSAFGSGLFVNKDAEYTKSCGIDGVYGTADDGLPTSLEELIILCDYMKSGVGEDVQPFTTYGTDPAMKEILVKALWASLAGSQQYATQYTFNGKVETVTGLTNQNAFDGIDYVKLPTTKERDVILRNGFYATNQTSRYWATAMLSIIVSEGWFSSITDPELTERETASKFLMNGSSTEGQMNPVCAMFIENDSWSNRLENWGLIEEYNNYYKGVRPLELAWMPMPTKVFGTVEANESNKPNQYFEAQNQGGAMVINKSATQDASTLELCKKFLQFINTDDALSLYTASTGVYRCCMNYQVSAKHTSNVNGIKKSIINTFSGVESKVSPVESQMYNPVLFSYYEKGVFIGGLGSLISVTFMDAYDLYRKSCVSELKWNLIKNGQLTWYSPDPEEIE